jgi:tRNA(Ile)-lysidine synthase
VVQDKDMKSVLELHGLRTIRKYGMIRPGDHVLVAVSGGADSMALLLFLHGLAPGMNLTLTVAHLDHGLRGTESHEDREFVHRVSAGLGLACVCESVDVRSMADTEGRNLEETARKVRYDFLRRAAAAAGANRIATGHTRSDQAETVLFRLLRGSGPGGLEGIHAVIDGRIIRPLLDCSRDSILEFLNKHDAEWREDSSNRDVSFQRNRIRHELVPYLEKHFNPQIVPALTRDAALVAAAYDFLEQNAGLIYDGLRTPLPDGISLAVAGLAALHPALRHQVIRRALREVLGSLQGIEAVHILDLTALCGSAKSGRRLQLPRGLEAQRNLERLDIRRGPAPGTPGFRYPLPWPGRCWIAELGMEFVASIQEGSEAAAGPGIHFRASALLDHEALPDVLTVRSRLPGDRYGGEGHRKVKKMLLSARIAVPERSSCPMLAAGDVVIWIPGFPPAKSFRAKPGSRRSVLVEAGRPVFVGT